MTEKQHREIVTLIMISLMIVINDSGVEAKILVESEIKK